MESVANALGKGQRYISLGHRTAIPRFHSHLPRIVGACCRPPCGGIDGCIGELWVGTLNCLPVAGVYKWEASQPNSCNDGTKMGHCMVVHTE